jgi:hypothetical protein
MTQWQQSVANAKFFFGFMACTVFELTAAMLTGLLALSVPIGALWVVAKCLGY